MHTTAAVFDSSRALTVAFIHGSEDCMFCGLITWEIQARNMFANLNKIETGGKRNKTVCIRETYIQHNHDADSSVLSVICYM